MSELILMLHEKDSSVGTTIEWCERRGVGYELAVASDSEDRFKNQFNPTQTEAYNASIMVFGGDMQVWETAKYPWLASQKNWLKRALEQKTKVFGLCLGAQLLAEQLGAQVAPLNKWTIGWYPVEPTNAASETCSVVENNSDLTLTPLHWHCSGFALPKGARQLVKSEPNECQGFEFTRRVCGFQFHSEIDEKRLAHAIEGWQPGLPGKIQTPQELSQKGQIYMSDLKKWYFKQLDRWWES